MTKSDDTCHTHGIQFTLGRQAVYMSLLKKEKRILLTTNVDSIHLSVGYLLQSYFGKVEDILTACSNIKQKLQSYMTHKVRCTNKKIAIKRIENNMIIKLRESKGEHVQYMMSQKYEFQIEFSRQNRTNVEFDVSL